MQRYFIDKNQINNNIITITGDDVHHIKTVMRMRINEKVLVCDEDKTYLCSIISISNTVEVEILETLEENVEMDINVTVAHGLVRREKMEEVVRRLVELGCYSYIPVNMTRSVVKHKEINIDRLNKIIKEASEQSMRLDIPNVKIERNKDNLENLVGLKLLCSTQEKDKTVKNLLKNTRNYDKINIMIGPEGGFSLKEEIYFEKKGFTKVSLGSQIMRVETVPVFLASIIRYEYMEWLYEKYTRLYCWK